MTVQTYLLPESLPEALGYLDRYGSDLLVIAGGTVAMPLINEGISMPTHVMGLRRAGLDTIELSDDAVRIGAAVTLSRLLALDTLPLVREAAATTGAWAVRNMASIGGNLFTPPPGGDVAVALLALDAEVELASSSGRRTVPLAEFHTGFLMQDLRPDELVAGIVVPTPVGRTAWRKFGRRRANTPAVVSVAVRIAETDGLVSEARVALGAAGPHPIRAHGAEALLVGAALDHAMIDAAAEAAAREASPETDAIATEWYRRRMIRLFVARALRSLDPTLTSEDRR